MRVTRIHTTPAVLADVEWIDEVPVYRIAGQCVFPVAIRLVTDAIEHAMQWRHARCLIEGIHLWGFDPPSIALRHQMVRTWAQAADGRGHIALVVRPELIDHQKFAVTAGRNFGLNSDVFHDEADVLAWLKAQA
jgi:hypothetical protein